MATSAASLRHPASERARAAPAQVSMCHWQTLGNPRAPDSFACRRRRRRCLCLFTCHSNSGARREPRASSRPLDSLGSRKAPRFRVVSCRVAAIHITSAPTRNSAKGFPIICSFFRSFIRLKCSLQTFLEDSTADECRPSPPDR